MAIYMVLSSGRHSDKEREDAIEVGKFSFNEELGYASKSFLLFRGALMNKEWIEDWREEKFMRNFCLHGSTSTSKNLDVALGFS